MSVAEFEVRAAPHSDTGHHRAENQDSALVHTPVFLVADGMGGHAAGREAADLVTATFAAHPWRARVTPGDLDAALGAADGAMRRLGDLHAQPPGSTLTGVALAEHEGAPAWLVFNVGDSRTYLLRDGALQQITHDHSHLQNLIDQGLDPRAGGARPRNYITRAIGGGIRERPRLDFWFIPARTGDRLLSCSDGLSGEIDPDLIVDLLLHAPDPATAAASLVASVLAGAARDNVTAVVVDAVRVGGVSPTARVATTEPTVEIDPFAGDTVQIPVPFPAQQP